MKIIRRKNNKLRARETRKRKKNYISELEDRITALEVENARLQDIIKSYKKKEVDGNLQSEAITLDKVLEQDQQLIKNWMNGGS